MSKFTVRIELHDAKWDDYETLHAAMAEKGFSRFVTADDGQTYHLPWAEYSAVGDLTSAQVRDIAQAAAATTGKRHGVLVTESNGRAWAGLVPA
jgi:hypothetical protein